MHNLIAFTISYSFVGRKRENDSELLIKVYRVSTMKHRREKKPTVLIDSKCSITKAP